MGLAKGQSVYITPLKKEGVVHDVLSSDRYRVAIGALLVVCAGGDLEPRTPRPTTTSASPTTAPKRSDRSVSPTLDLHGYTVDEALHALDSWLNALILSQQSQGKVVHGFGTGKVQRAVHERLSQLSAVRAFRINDRNPGETDVFL